jgi:hypothetical protein
MPRPEDIIADASARRKKLAGPGKKKKKSAPAGPNMSEFVDDVFKAARAMKSAGSDTVRQKQAKAMFAKIRRKHGIK